MTRRTKIVATIGPASDSPETLRALIAAGVDVARINLSHGTVDEHLDRLARLRSAADDVGRVLAVLADLPGPKIRSGPFPDGGVSLPVGWTVRLRPGDGPSDRDVIHVRYPELLDDLSPGCDVQLGDGAISMEVVDVDEREAVARIETGGRANGEPGVHLPSDTVKLRAPTESDLELAGVFADAGVEYMAVSFVRDADDVEQVRAVTGDRVRLVSKIETRVALQNLHEIIDASDAVMVARGDLGIDCPLEDVPHIQKRIVRRCVEIGTPVITATQMLESMIAAPAPTRAELSDVANAVYDGTDALMLSGETAIGHDPVAVVTAMGRIAARAESEANYRRWADLLGNVQFDRNDVQLVDHITAAITHAASQAARDVDADAILCFTRSGRTARAMARFRPRARMIGMSPDPSAMRSLALTWGVEPVSVGTYETADQQVWFAVEAAVEKNLLQQGNTVLVLAGTPAEAGHAASVATDVLRIVDID